MDSQPCLTVITPHNGQTNLGHFLQALALQSLSPGKYEVVMVTQDPGATEKLIHHFRDYLRIRLVRWEQRSFHGHPAGIMRNLGAAEARGERLVFLDSDCVLSPNGLQIHTASEFVSADRVVLCGTVPELPAGHVRRLAEGFYGSFEALASKAHEDFRVRHASEKGWRRARWDEVYAGNFSTPRALFLSIGGFDEEGYRCHDMEIGYRFHRHGAELWLFPDCRAIHLEHSRLLSFRDEQAKGWRHIANKHPELAAETHDRLLAISDLKGSVRARCERRFGELTSRLEGVRANRTFVLSPAAGAEPLLELLDRIPHEKRPAEGALRYALRLDRDSWDYELLLPEIDPAAAPEVSVAIPMFNASGTIRRAVDSVFSQRFQSFEIILIDDASTDESLQRLNKYLPDGRLRVVRLPRNRGLANALNRALVAARGRYLVQLDSDDWLEPDALGEIVTGFRNQPTAGAIYGAPFVHKGDAMWKDKGRAVSHPVEVLSYSGIQAPRAYRVDVLRQIGGWDVSDAYGGRFYEDRHTLARVARVAGLGFCSKAIYHVNVRENSLARKDAHKGASAKVAIAWSHARDMGMLTEVSPMGKFAEARFYLRSDSAPQQRWSVIIPFRGRLPLLLNTLRSWQESDFDRSDAEILIVNDQSGEDLESIKQLSPRIRVLSPKGVGGPAASRNFGVANAQGEMLFFCDSDMIVPRNVLACHERRHREASRPGLVIGTTFGWSAFTELCPGIPRERLRRLMEVLTFDEAAFTKVVNTMLDGRGGQLVGNGSNLDGSDLWAQVRKFSFVEPWCRDWGELMLHFGDDLAGFPHRWMRVGTRNLSIAVTQFRQLGGFDETFFSMEDWELGIRAQQQQFSISTAPEAEPIHQIHPVDVRRKGFNLNAVDQLRRKHPDEIRRLARAFPTLRPPGAFEIVDCLEKLELADSTIREVTKPNNHHPPQCLPFALTFDDGPHPAVTPRLLEILNANGMVATFFVLGINVRRFGSICNAIVSAGHEIAVHGWDHDDMSHKYSAEIHRALERSIKVIEDVAGVTPTYCRPAYGRSSPAYVAACGTFGLKPVGWHVHSSDWAGITWQEILTDLIVGGISGKVLLLHDGTSDPDQLLPAVNHLAQLASRYGLSGLAVRDYARRLPLPALGD